MTEFSYQDDVFITQNNEEEEVNINIVDAICGSGKTSAAINMINASDEEQRFLYIHRSYSLQVLAIFLLNLSF